MLNNHVFGNKSRNLEQLKKSGFKVPPFFTIHANDLPSEKELLKRVSSELPSIQFFAVRSSAANEDTANKSFAGHYYSAVGVNKKDLYSEVKKVKKSFEGTDGAVIIQEFIPSDKAGVIFTNGGDGTSIINATFGLCENVVRGFSCDEYVISEKTELITKQVSDKNIHLFHEGVLEDGRSSEQVLDEAEMRSLVVVGKRIEKEMSAPQDIEWCIYKNELYILQTRPITKAVFNQAVNYFDSANVAESYSGIVLPLTFSFASKMYESVYCQLLKSSGVSTKKIEENKSIFQNMLGLFYGRMYYNMNNWYKMMRLLPGYKRNKKNLELMITSNIHQDVHMEDDLKPSFWLNIKYPFLVVFKLFVFKSTIEKFKRKVNQKLSNLRNVDLSKLALSECRELYFSLEKDLLNDWHVTVENDFLVMTYFGILERRIEDTLLKRVIDFSNTGADQVRKFHEISCAIKSSPLLWEEIKQKNKKKFFKILCNYKNVEVLLSEYFFKYGGRFANELKLESRDLEEDFSKFSDLVELYGQAETTQYSKSEYKRNKIRNPFLTLILQKFKKYAAQREELRLLRSNAFSIIRKIFNRIGVILVEDGTIRKSGDIFYLKIEEVLSGEIPDGFQIEHRKNEYKSYVEITPPRHFSLAEGEILQIVKKDISKNQFISGRTCSPGRLVGKVKVFKEFSVPKKIDFDILVTKFTDPGWATLIGKTKGMIIENGGVLSHAAIIARELNIPTVIGAEDATEILKDGQMVELDGSTGLITILS